MFTVYDNDDFDFRVELAELREKGDKVLFKTVFKSGDADTDFVMFCHTDVGRFEGYGLWCGNFFPKLLEPVGQGKIPFSVEIKDGAVRRIYIGGRGISQACGKFSLVSVGSQFEVVAKLGGVAECFHPMPQNKKGENRLVMPVVFEFRIVVMAAAIRDIGKDTLIGAVIQPFLEKGYAAGIFLIQLRGTGDLFCIVKAWLICIHQDKTIAFCPHDIGMSAIGSMYIEKEDAPFLLAKSGQWFKRSDNLRAAVAVYDDVAIFGSS